MQIEAEPMRRLKTSLAATRKIALYQAIALNYREYSVPTCKVANAVNSTIELFSSVFT